MSIVEFLERCIAEDEAAAIRAQRHPADGPLERWESGPGAHADRHLYDGVVEPANVGSRPGLPLIKAARRPVARHIARHDPARVLAECAAKRAQIAHLIEFVEGDYAPWNEVQLRIMAVAYADHPDYDDSWRP